MKWRLRQRRHRLGLPEQEAAWADAAAMAALGAVEDRIPTPVDDIVERHDVQVHSLDLETAPTAVVRAAERAARGGRRLNGYADADRAIIYVSPHLADDLRRFTLAHELAHIVLPEHRRLAGGASSPQVQAVLEREADRFASTMLGQGRRFTDDLRSKPMTIDAICQQASRWGIPPATAARRAVLEHTGACALVDIDLLAHWPRRGGSWESELTWSTWGPVAQRVPRSQHGFALLRHLASTTKTSVIRDEVLISTPWRADVRVDVEVWPVDATNALALFPWLPVVRR